MPLNIYSRSELQLLCLTKVSERVSFVLNSKITGQYILALLTNLTLTSNGSLDHPDLLEGQDDDKLQNSEKLKYGKLLFPVPADHTVPSNLPYKFGHYFQIYRNLYQ